MKALSKKVIAILLMASMQMACSAKGTSEAPVQSEAQAFETVLQSFITDHQSLNLPSFSLSFLENLQGLGDMENLRNQKTVFERHLKFLAGIDAEKLNICDRIAHSVLQSEASFGLRRAELGLQFSEHMVDLSSITRLAEMPMGTDWYRFYMDKWNGAILKPDEIFAFGEDQLRRSIAKYDAVQRELGFEGDDEGLARHLENSARLEGGEPTRQYFLKQQARVWDALPQLFSETYGVQPAIIMRSDRGAAFPVPGYYNGAESTFFYNVLEDGYSIRQADWLLLHEDTPGHHFQTMAAASHSRCPARLSNFSQPAYAEGWGAYVETLGEDLGMYQTPEAWLAAIEWDMVRSVRVVLDVALNAYGWSDERALAYWRDHVRGQQDIAQREIDRMKRWPAQVVTYKYGANIFETVKSGYVTGPGDMTRIKTFHDTALAYGTMPLESFETLFPALAAHSDASRAAENN